MESMWCDENWKMYIRKPRGLTTGNLMIGTVLGLAGGIYIWKQPLKQYASEKKALEEKSKQEVKK